MKPQHHIHLIPGDVGKTVLLPGDPGRVQFIASFFDNAKHVATNREYVTYTGEYKGVKISCTSTGIGCPSASIALEELANVGAQNFIRVGTCGALQPEIKPGDIIIATAAVRGDGTSTEYTPIEYPAVADHFVTSALVASAGVLGADFRLGVIRSHDAFYIESPFAHGDWSSRIKKWTEMGVLAVENESSALFVVANYRRVKAGTVLVAAGNLISGSEAEDRKMLEKPLEMAIKIACESATLLEKDE